MVRTSPDTGAAILARRPAIPAFVDNVTTAATMLTLAQGSLLVRCPSVTNLLISAQSASPPPLTQSRFICYYGADRSLAKQAAA
jgi:hypothetical protein